MKVLAEGARKPLRHEGVWACTGCRRIVEVERSDGNFVIDIHEAESVRDDTYLVMECPICKSQTRWCKAQRPKTPW